MSVIYLIVAGSLLLAAPNPVLPKTANVGVFRHAGQYYLMGIGASGGTHISDDLMHGSGPMSTGSRHEGAAKRIALAAAAVLGGIVHLLLVLRICEKKTGKEAQ